MKVKSYNSNYSFDMFTDKEVVFCKGRGKRPIVSGGKISKEQCPFCPGAEEDTPQTIMAVGDPWIMRVIENKYPAVASLDDENFAVRGLHYVVIETNNHYKKLSEFDEEEISQLFNLYTVSYTHLKSYRRKSIFTIRCFGASKRLSRYINKRSSSITGCYCYSTMQFNTRI